MNEMHDDRPEDLDLLFSYTKKIGINFDVDRISEKLGKELFVLIIKNYRSGVVSVDSLSALCELMYGKFDPLSDMYELLLNGAEIEWYIRNEPGKAAIFIEDLLRNFGTV